MAQPAKSRTGTVRKRDNGRWQARFYDAEGRERSHTFNRKAEAERWLNETIAAIANGTWEDPRREKVAPGTYRDLTERWKRGEWNKLKPSTRHRYEGILRKYLLPRFGDTLLDDLELKAIQGWVDELAADPKRSPATVDRMFTVLRTSLKYAVKIRLLEYPPTVGVGLPQTLEREMLYLHTPEQVEPLARGFPDRYYTLIYFAAFTGMRFGEIAGLTIKRLDLMRSHVYVEDTLTDIDGTLTWGTPKSRKGRRNFSLPEDLRDMLVAHIAEFVDDPTDRDSLVFTSARGPRSHERRQAFPNGSPLRASGFNKPWKRTVPKVLPPELHRLRFHDLRHTCAALMIANGEAPLTISRQLGHASISITMDVYGHLMPEVSLEAARGLNSMIRRAKAAPEPAAEDVG